MPIHPTAYPPSTTGTTRTDVQQAALAEGKVALGLLTTRRTTTGHR